VPWRARSPARGKHTRAIMKGSAVQRVEVWPASGIMYTQRQCALLLSSVPPYHCLALHLYRPHSTVPSFVLPRVGLSPLPGLTFTLLHSSPPSFLSSLERQIHIRPPLPPPSPPPSSGGSQRVLHSAIVPFCRFIPCRFSSSSSRPFFVLPFTWSASNDSSLFFNTVYPSFGLSSRLVLAFYVSIIANTFRSLAFPSSITSNRTVLRFGIDTL